MKANWKENGQRLSSLSKAQGQIFTRETIQNCTPSREEEKRNGEKIIINWYFRICSSLLIATKRARANAVSSIQWRDECQRTELFFTLYFSISASVHRIENKNNERERAKAPFLSYGSLNYGNSVGVSVGIQQRVRFAFNVLPFYVNSIAVFKTRDRRRKKMGPPRAPLSDRRDACSVCVRCVGCWMLAVKRIRDWCICQALNIKNYSRIELFTQAYTRAERLRRHAHAKLLRNVHKKKMAWNNMTGETRPDTRKNEIFNENSAFAEPAHSSVALFCVRSSFFRRFVCSIAFSVDPISQCKQVLYFSTALRTSQWPSLLD